MVRTEERDKIIGMAREGRGMPISQPSGGGGGKHFVSSSYEDVYNNKDEGGPMKTRDKIDKVERDIVRLTMIAEKDKRESIACTNKIKKLREQLQVLLDNPGDEIRRCYSENDLVAQYSDKAGFSVTPPPSSMPTFRPMQNSSLRLNTTNTENKSPNISPNLSPLLDDNISKSQESTRLEKILAAKEDELARVKQRAREEAARAAKFREEEEELTRVVAAELELRKRANQDMRTSIARKEREIQRLMMLAEKDKRNGMFMRDQIESQKKTLVAFAKAHGEKRPELLRVIHSCDDIVIPSSPSPSIATTTGSYSSSGSITPLSLTPTSPSGVSMLRTSSNSSSCSSPLRAEADSLLRAEAHKEEELHRVSAIAGMEASRASILKSKANELKQVIANELQGANEELERKIRKIRNQQDAIHKVVARAEAERARACLLHEQLSALTKQLYGNQGDPSANEAKTNEFLPDKAYLSEFKELTALVPVSDLNTPNDPITNPSNKDDPHSHAYSSQCNCVDPITVVQSPPCKQISFCESEAVFVQKLQDMEALDRESARVDEELTRVKRLKEAEIARRMLLAEKVIDLHAMIEMS